MAITTLIVWGLLRRPDTEKPKLANLMVYIYMAVLVAKLTRIV